MCREASPIVSFRSVRLLVGCGLVTLILLNLMQEKPIKEDELIGSMFDEDRTILEELLLSQKGGWDEGALRCPIYTYYERFAQWQPQENQTQLIGIWLRSWYSEGFFPIILSRKDAEAHPSFVEFRDKVSTLPTVNPPEYELACYIRWLAFAHAGGGSFVDYDVMPLSGFRLPEKAAGCGRQGLPLVSYDRLIPMLVHANVTGVERLLQRMATY